MLFNVSEAAIALSTILKDGSHIERYERRLRHLIAGGVLEIAERDGTGPKAASLLSLRETCLASLLVFTAEVLDFDIHLQRAIARGARAVGFGGGLSRAIDGVADGEQWAISISVRGPDDLVARFVPIEDAQPNPAAEELLEATGRSLIAKVIIGINELFEPFAQYARA